MTTEPPQPGAGPPAHVVRRIFHEYSRGRGLQTIAAGLNEDDIPKGQRGSTWTKSAVRAVLLNPRCAALVPLGDAEHVRNLFASRRLNPPGASSSGRRLYVLRGLLRCARCNRLMEGTWNNGEPYYRCRFPAGRPVTDPGHHSHNVYVRERRVLGPLTSWLHSVCSSTRLTQATTGTASPEESQEMATRAAHHVRALDGSDPRAQAEALRGLGLRLAYADAERLLHVKAVLEPVQFVVKETLVL
ncbi:hypothetical protein F7R91_21065 [Streptomyces luteolifulvus]|uniref:Recombinase domain-containing protein n=1 Tax=Streptomyces luteolifulvus TaxID=2615112 RepID=A0A6H9UXY7_9ACTN|nr:hypothetical protein F7R91_21065 [Streptomyces luteolifulvus]